MEDQGERGESVFEDIELQIAVLGRNFELLHRRAPATPDVERAEYLLLRVLAKLGPSTVGTLATTLGLDSSTIGRQVSSLEASALAERVADPHDRRRTIVEMTELGRRRMNETSRARTLRTQALLADWNPEDLLTLATMFRRYNAAVTRTYLGEPGALDHQAEGDPEAG
ncbi:MarR family winged helix-turn-helix transcriptional regulator [Tsukamurella soli]